MKNECLKCKRNTDNIDPKMFRTKNNRLLMQSKFSVCKSKKSRFVKEQDAKGLLSNLGINKIFKHMTAISKNVYFVVLDDIVNKYNNTVHRTIKMKPIEVTDILMLNTMKIQIKEILSLKLVIM